MTRLLQSGSDSHILITTTTKITKTTKTKQQQQINKIKD